MPLAYTNTEVYSVVFYDYVGRKLEVIANIVRSKMVEITDMHVHPITLNDLC